MKKVPHPKSLNQLRKICGTSDYSKLFESFIKEWIVEDMQENIDKSQYGDEKGTGTEHLIVCFIDRVSKLLDSAGGKAAVIAASCDWASAFDRVSPMVAAEKFIRLGLRPSLVRLLISYMSGRQMKVKFRGKVSQPRGLIGGGGQGTLIGGKQYIVASNDVAEEVDTEDKYRFIDDIEVLDLVMLSGVLRDYDYWSHVPSDIGIEQKYLPTEYSNIQRYLHNIQTWSDVNLTKLNVEKSNYIVFSRCHTDFALRLFMNNENIERKKAIKLLGVWISEDLSWDLNSQEMCKKAYKRITLLTKLKYVGVSTTDLVTIYTLFIRSCLEYCSVVFHSSLTKQQCEMIERVQKICLKVVLYPNYTDYENALVTCKLSKLTDQREKRCLNFSIKCTKHQKHTKMFPVSETFKNNSHNIRNPQKYTVNFAKSESYRSSSIPYCQRLLNDHWMEQQKQ